MPEAAITIPISTLFLVLVGLVNLIVLGPLAWILRSVIQDLHELKDALSGLKQDLPITYIRREQYVPDMAEIKNLLHGIFNELKNKQDKE